MMKIFQGAFCKHYKKWGKSNLKTGGRWITKPFSYWKKPTAKMKEHAESEGHIMACQTETAAASALCKVLFFSKCTDWKNVRG